MGWYGDADKDSFCAHCRRRVSVSETMFGDLCRQCHENPVKVKLEKRYTCSPRDYSHAVITLRSGQNVIVLADEKSDVVGQPLAPVIARAERHVKMALQSCLAELEGETEA